MVAERTISRATGRGEATVCPRTVGQPAVVLMMFACNSPPAAGGAARRNKEEVGRRNNYLFVSREVHMLPNRSSPGTPGWSDDDGCHICSLPTAGNADCSAATADRSSSSSAAAAIVVAWPATADHTARQAHSLLVIQPALKPPSSLPLAKDGYHPSGRVTSAAASALACARRCPSSSAARAVPPALCTAPLSFDGWTARGPSLLPAPSAYFSLQGERGEAAASGVPRSGLGARAAERAGRCAAHPARELQVNTPQSRPPCQGQRRGYRQRWRPPDPLRAAYISVRCGTVGMRRRETQSAVPKGGTSD